MSEYKGGGDKLEIGKDARSQDPRREFLNFQVNEHFFQVSEPGGGSDVASLTTSAR